MAIHEKMSEEQQETQQVVELDDPAPTPPTSNELVIVNTMTIKEQCVTNKNRYQIILYNDLFETILTKVYKRLVKIEQSNNINDNSMFRISSNELIDELFVNSTIQPKAYFGTHFIQINYKNYVDVQTRLNNIHQLIEYDYYDCMHIDILKLFKAVSGKKDVDSLPIPYAFIKINKEQLIHFKDDQDVLNIAMANLTIISRMKEINNVDGHRIKVCKYENKKNIYLIIFFDSLNYSSQSGSNSGSTYWFDDHYFVNTINPSKCRVYMNRDGIVKKTWKEWLGF